MSIYTMSRKDLIAKCERDDAAVARAAGVLSDNAELQARVRDLRAELAAEKSKPPREVVREVVKKVEVPGPVREVVKVQVVEKPGPVREVVKKVPTQCPKQAAEIKRLEKNIASLKSQPPKEVVREVIKQVPHRVEIPRPCPKQAAQVKALQSELDKFAKYDMDEFKKWCRMVDVARGAK